MYREAIAFFAYRPRMECMASRKLISAEGPLHTALTSVVFKNLLGRYRDELDARLGFNGSAG